MRYPAARIGLYEPQTFEHTEFAHEHDVKGLGPNGRQCHNDAGHIALEVWSVVVLTIQDFD